jgi:uncharacterized protein (DUF2147 family)
MKNLMLIIMFALSLNPLMAANGKPEKDAILGEWINEKGDAKFLIYRSGGQYFGKITWGTGGDTKDSKNPDPKKREQDLVGLVILKDFEFKGQKTWSGGTIYDPKDGKTYSCILNLKNPNLLEVRGYVGITLFGRSETWTKVESTKN